MQRFAEKTIIFLCASSAFSAPLRWWIGSPGSHLDDAHSNCYEYCKRFARKKSSATQILPHPHERGIGARRKAARGRLV